MVVNRYKAFSKHLDNIGDITAKGEAQIAVIDIIGMWIGISLSKSINSSKWKIVGIIGFLSFLELFCVYHEIRRYSTTSFMMILLIIVLISFVVWFIII